MSEELPWWITNFGIEEIWKKTKGAGVTVAIMDTGINSSHPDLEGSITEFIDVFDINGKAIDENSHGSHCAGIIAGRGISSVTGVAPAVNLIVVKVMIQNLKYDKLRLGLTKLKDKNVDLITLSTGILDDVPEIHQLITHYTNNKIPIVSAIGNNKGRKDESGYFPAKYIESISVGSLNTNEELAFETDRNKTLTICAPGEKIISCDRNGKLVEKSGSSMATAYVSGVIALGISWLKAKKKDYNTESLKNKLINTSLTKITGSYPYRVIRPFEFFKQL
jgi:major intracellular serine protease